MTTAAWETAEWAARESYGRLVAYLAIRSRDMVEAEDALSDAFRAALERWPREGIPDNPEAWLLTVARRRLADLARHAKVVNDAAPSVQQIAEAATDAAVNHIFPDERLKLLFICAHPAIDPAARTPLMLQTVLGLSGERIASEFLVKPMTMSQRLVRTKAKIRDARITFDVPEREDLPARLDAVLEAIYAAYGASWDDAIGADTQHIGLAAEAIVLARMLLQLMPDQPEAQGLLALLLYCEARRNARHGPGGEYVPLSDQDVTRWDGATIIEAEKWLQLASTCHHMGRFQLEAAIQSVHCQRAITGKTHWEAIALLYEGLVRLSPTMGAMVSRAAAIAEARGPALGLAVLEELAPAAQTYQPYWAVRAHLLAQLHEHAGAKEAYSRAIGLSEDEQVRLFLIKQKLRLAH